MWSLAKKPGKSSLSMSTALCGGLSFLFNLMLEKQQEKQNKQGFLSLQPFSTEYYYNLFLISTPRTNVEMCSENIYKADESILEIRRLHKKNVQSQPGYLCREIVIHFHLYFTISKRRRKLKLRNDKKIIKTKPAWKQVTHTDGN